MYIMVPVPLCFRLLIQVIARADSRACAKTGNRIAARIAMIAMTTSSSMRVKPDLLLMFMLLSLQYERNYSDTDWPDGYPLGPAEVLRGCWAGPPPFVVRCLQG